MSNALAARYVTYGAKNLRSLLKRSIVGSREKTSVKHLDTLEWCFHNRDKPYLFRDTIKRLLAADNVEFKKLTA